MRILAAGRLAVTALVVAGAALVGWQLWIYYMEDPWTRDGKVRADVVTVAPDVAGWVASVEVADNQAVRAGAVLFRIDPERAKLALAQAEAALANRIATMQQAERDARRYASLDHTAVSAQKQEQTAAIYQAALADLRQAAADRDLARLNLARTEIRAKVNGLATNVGLQPGVYVNVGQGVMALVATDTLHVDGYFEETKLARIRIGAPVQVRLMGDARTITGEVESIAGGVADRERSDAAGTLANVNPTFSWVRLAQRIPVRIRLTRVPPGVALVVGRTATVSVLPGREADPAAPALARVTGGDGTLP